nr:hypothetical protein [Tanacetum cinerariifolium]
GTGTINKSVQTHLKKVVPIAAPDFEEQTDETHNEFQVIQHTPSSQFGDQPTQKKSCHDDQDSLTDVDTDLKKRKRKDSNASPSKESKDKEVSSKEGKAPSKSSKTDKAVDAEEM